MQKKGMEYQTILYAFGVIVIAALALVGYRSISTASDKLCKTDLLDFQKMLQDAALDLRLGTVQNKELEAPCNAEKIYLFDSQDKPNAELFSNPIIKESIVSGSAQNVFIVKEGSVLESFSSPHINIAYPYFGCIIPLSGKISMRMEGLGSRADVQQSCQQQSCGGVPQPYDDTQARLVLSEALKEGHIIDIFSEQDQTRTLYENKIAAVSREYLACDGKLTMKITVDLKEGQNIDSFRYFERFDERCPDMSNAIANIHYPSIIVFENKHRSLLSLGAASPVSNQITISYDIPVRVSDDCLKGIVGLVVGS